MSKFIIIFIVLIFSQSGIAVEIVEDGKAVADIVLSGKAKPGEKTAAKELQRHIEKMSGARLPIVNTPSKNIKNHIFVGESSFTRKLNITLDDVKDDGFKIVSGKTFLVLAGKEIDNYATYAKWPQNRGRQKRWEKYCEHHWRFPPLLSSRDFSNVCGFHLNDGTGTLYAVYYFLEELGMRWYMPVPEIGIVYPKLENISIKTSSLKKEPEFSQRIFVDTSCGKFTNEFLWYKSMKVGTSFNMPIYHSLSGLLLERTSKLKASLPKEYFGKFNGKIDYNIPNLMDHKLQEDFIKYLEFVDKEFPTKYTCIGQPDGWMKIDDTGRLAGWDKITEGPYGRFSDYYWSFLLKIRKQYMEKHPDRKFTVFAYYRTTNPPKIIKKIPENITVAFCQTSLDWALEPSLGIRKEWVAKMPNPNNQLLVWEYYIQHADRFKFPPIPIIFTKFMTENFKALYKEGTGFLVELGWNGIKERLKYKLGLRRPGLMHLMLYLHSRLCWDRNLDIQAVLDEYYKLFFGPAEKEMKEFYEYSEKIWINLKAREIEAIRQQLTKSDVNKYFEILNRAKKKAGNSIYGKRIDFIITEMADLKRLHDKTNRVGPKIVVFKSAETAQINGNLGKTFWRKRPFSFIALRDMITGGLPEHIETNVSFRWLKDNSGLAVAVECIEPKMNKVRADSKERDSASIFSDDFVEIRIESQSGLRPKIVVNPNGVVYDSCITKDVRDLPEFYTVKDISVKKYYDKWTVELIVDAKSIGGSIPTKKFPWGVKVCRQRMAGNVPEYYMLSPSGTSFKDMKYMANIIVAK